MVGFRELHEQWKSDLVFGNDGEKIIHEMYFPESDIVNEKGYDLLVPKFVENVEGYMIEVKTDRVTLTSGNLAFELWSHNFNHTYPGWTQYCPADILVYMIWDVANKKADSVRFYYWPDLQRYIFEEVLLKDWNCKKPNLPYKRNSNRISFRNKNGEPTVNLIIDKDYPPLRQFLMKPEIFYDKTE